MHRSFFPLPANAPIPTPQRPPSQNSSQRQPPGQQARSYTCTDATTHPSLPAAPRLLQYRQLPTKEICPKETAQPFLSRAGCWSSSLNSQRRQKTRNVTPGRDARLQLVLLSLGRARVPPPFLALPCPFPSERFLSEPLPRAALFPFGGEEGEVGGRGRVPLHRLPSAKQGACLQTCSAVHVPEHRREMRASAPCQSTDASPLFPP
mmetsp:Transcript_49603/g.97733  ORF Transcript_49603/g.97733 Transcript_49603/m.97733 type:complete len:206 (-) Transcript_49603:430-1047(-)